MNVQIETGPNAKHQAAVESFLESHWGSTTIVSKGHVTNAAKTPRVLALNHDQIIGLATYVIDSEKGECELVSLDAVAPRQGVGSALIKEVERQARAAGCAKIWLITTNTNPEAAVFYVKQGYRLVAIHLDALATSRKLKPQIPLTDDRGIPLTDEWEFSKAL